MSRSGPVNQPNRRIVLADGPAPTGGRTAPHAASTSLEAEPAISISIDVFADAALAARRDAKGPVQCDACDQEVIGEAAGSGLYLWSRDGELRWDEPALCEGCATVIGVTALRLWDAEEEEG